jgi:hypothetical protein
VAIAKQAFIKAGKYVQQKRGKSPYKMGDFPLDRYLKISEISTIINF